MSPNPTRPCPLTPPDPLPVLPLTHLLPVINMFTLRIGFFFVCVCMVRVKALSSTRTSATAILSQDAEHDGMGLERTATGWPLPLYCNLVVLTSGRSFVPHPHPPIPPAPASFSIIPSRPPKRTCPPPPPPFAFFFWWDHRQSWCGSVKRWMGGGGRGGGVGVGFCVSGHKADGLVPVGSETVWRQSRTECL